MKITKLVPVVLTIILSSVCARAQSIDESVKNWERAKAYTLEYLETMPEAGYALKPTPEMRSFAEQMLHLTETDYGFISGVTGEKRAVNDLEKTTTDKSKANITKIVTDGYDFVITSLKKISPSSWDEQIKLFGRVDISRREAMSRAFEHQTHHRGQATVYLRLAKVTPPREKLF